MKIFDNDVILFDGDSITDALRDRNDKYSLAGYSKAVYEQISTKLPKVKCYNRGIGGDTSAQLNDRVAAELDEIRPTVFSLLIGVNDTWRKFDSGITITAEEYGKNVDEILTKAKRFTDRIIVIEPFLLDVDPQKKPFREDLYPKICTLREVVRGYNAEYVPMDGIFAELCCRNAPDKFSYDGVHPTAQGHEIIAKEWLRRVAF